LLYFFFYLPLFGLAKELPFGVCSEQMSTKPLLT